MTYHNKAQESIPQHIADNLDYVSSIGSIQTTPDWVMTKTRSGDTLAELARSYGVSAQQIATVNNVPFDSNSINQWVMSRGGKMLSSGWAAFTSESEILLPNKRRSSTPAVTSTPSKNLDPEMSNRKEKSEFLKWSLVAGGTAVVAVTVIGAVFGKRRKKRK